MVRIVTNKLQTTSKELQEHLAADNVNVHCSTVQRTLHRTAQKKGDAEESFSAFCKQEESFGVYKGSSGQEWIILEKHTVERCHTHRNFALQKKKSIPGEESAPCKIWWRVHHSVGMCGKNRYWKEISLSRGKESVKRLKLWHGWTFSRTMTQSTVPDPPRNSCSDMIQSSKMVISVPRLGHLRKSIDWFFKKLFIIFFRKEEWILQGRMAQNAFSKNLGTYHWL